MIYESKAGSRVTVSARGRITVDLDWFEEGTCIEADPVFQNDPGEAPCIVATCGESCCVDQRGIAYSWEIPVFPIVVEGLGQLDES